MFYSDFPSRRETMKKILVFFCLLLVVVGAVTPGTASGSGRGVNFGIHAGISPTVWFYNAYRVGAEAAIYIPAENLGVRIEDDILITDSGPVVLSAGVPKKIEDIEWRMAERIRD
jgi:hypothetical protein